MRSHFCSSKVAIVYFSDKSWKKKKSSFKKVANADQASFLLKTHPKIAVESDELRQMLRESYIRNSSLKTYASKLRLLARYAGVKFPKKTNFSKLAEILRAAALEWVTIEKFLFLRGFSQSFSTSEGDFAALKRCFVDLFPLEFEKKGTFEQIYAAVRRWNKSEQIHRWSAPWLVFLKFLQSLFKILGSAGDEQERFLVALALLCAVMLLRRSDACRLYIPECREVQKVCSTVKVSPFIKLSIRDAKNDGVRGQLQTIEMPAEYLDPLGMDLRVILKQVLTPLGPAPNSKPNTLENRTKGFTEHKAMIFIKTQWRQFLNTLPPEVESHLEQNMTWGTLRNSMLNALVHNFGLSVPTVMTMSRHKNESVLFNNYLKSGKTLAGVRISEALVRNWKKRDFR